MVMVMKLMVMMVMMMMMVTMMMRRRRKRKRRRRRRRWGLRIGASRVRRRLMFFICLLRAWVVLVAFSYFDTAATIESKSWWTCNWWGSIRTRSGGVLSQGSHWNLQPPILQTWNYSNDIVAWWWFKGDEDNCNRRQNLGFGVVKGKPTPIPLLVPA